MDFEAKITVALDHVSDVLARPCVVNTLMELDSHAMDRDTSLLHTLNHIDGSLVLARAVRRTVVVVE